MGSGWVGFRLGGRFVTGGSPAVLCGCRAGTGNLGSLGARLDVVGVSELARRGGEASSR